jgi:hypothetical protein
MGDALWKGASPFTSHRIKNSYSLYQKLLHKGTGCTEFTQMKDEGYYCKQIMGEWNYLTQMTDESKNFIEMTIFSQKSIWLSFTFEDWLHFNATSEYTLPGQSFALLVFWNSWLLVARCMPHVHWGASRIIFRWETRVSEARLPFFLWETRGYLMGDALW